jgi:hypothetical protein
MSVSDFLSTIYASENITLRRVGRAKQQKKDAGKVRVKNKKKLF